MAATTTTSYGYSRIHRILEITGIISMLALSTTLAWGASLCVNWAQHWGLVTLAFMAAYLAADFFSGFVHWLADTYGTKKTPLFGPNFIGPFREHHVDPEGITRHDFIETNGNNCLLTLPVLVGVYVLIGPRPEGDFPLFSLLFWNVLSLLIFATNQIHKWAHMQAPPRLVVLLQRLRLILPRVAHRIHHTPPHDSHYCITTGWLNWPLQKLRFFEVLEWSIARLFRVRTARELVEVKESPIRGS